MIINAHVRIVLVCLSLSLLCGCNSADKQDTPTAAAPVTVAQSEIKFQGEDDAPEDRAAARQAVLDYVKQHLPEWTVKGVATASYHGNSYRAAVDIEKAGRREVLDLYVTNFFAEDGKSYWSAQTVDNSLDTALHNSEDVKAHKQLRQATKGDSDGEQDN